MKLILALAATMLATGAFAQTTMTRNGTSGAGGVTPTTSDTPQSSPPSGTAGTNPNDVGAPTNPDSSSLTGAQTTSPQPDVSKQPPSGVATSRATSGRERTRESVTASVGSASGDAVRHHGKRRHLKRHHHRTKRHRKASKHAR